MGTGFFDGQPIGVVVDQEGFYDGPDYTQMDTPTVTAFRDQAQAAAAASEASHQASQASANDAASSASAAAGSASTASGAASVAAGQATVATDKAGIATTQAGIATTSASNAATSEANALSYKNAAATSASNASTSEGNALSSKNAAATSASNASTSETNALASKNAAATSASNASTSETNALASKNAAATSASNASTSETNALSYKNAAGTSASNASTSETNALASKNAAATSASNASTSESNALSSKNAAATSASNAATSESNAAGSASAAATSASNAAGAVQLAAGTATPLVNGTAAVGTGTKWAREDHKHPADTATADARVAAAAGTATPAANGTAAIGVSTKWAHDDHVHPTDTSRAPLASPTFTGVPAAPTATAGTNTTQIATTAFVLANGTSLGSTVPSMDGTAAAGTSTVAARADHVHPTDTSRAPLASPAFTGTPTAPTPATSDNSTTIATTAFVKANAGSGGSSVSSLLKVCYGRLTPTSATAVPTSDVATATTLYFTPFGGAAISLYDGVSAWSTVSFTEKSLALTGLVASKPYDIFGYLSAGTLALEALAWTNDTTRATALSLQDGVYVKSTDTTRLYLGTIYTSAAGTTCDTTLKRYIWNAYNQVPRTMAVADSTDSWASSATALTYRQANNSAANRVDFVLGLASPVSATCVNIGISTDTTSRPIVAGIGLDTVTASSHTLSFPCHTGPTANYVHGMAVYEGSPVAGKHYLAWLDYCIAASTITFYGDAGTQTNGSFLMSGLTAKMWC